MVIQAADHNPMPGIGAADLVAGDHIGLRRQAVPQHRELRRIVLRVAVGIRDEILARGGKTGAECRTVTAIVRMVNHADARIRPHEIVEDIPG